MNLNAQWEFEFDNEDAGLGKEWFSGKQKLSRKILVPFCPESEMSRIGDTSFHPVVWYRRSFTLSNDWKRKNVLLKFGAVDYLAEVWVNGRHVGRHIGGHTPFGFNITRYLTDGANVVVVRAAQACGGCVGCRPVTGLSLWIGFVLGLTPQAFLLPPLTRLFFTLWSQIRA